MDKQDKLAALIHEAHRTAPYPWWHTDADKCRMAQHIAAVVRSFMGSDEVVGDAAQAIYECGPWTVQWHDLPMGDPSLIACVHDARAALSAAIGEDIGGGRG